MRLIILDDYNRVSDWAAKYVRNKIVAFLKANPEGFFTLGLPTGDKGGAIGLRDQTSNSVCDQTLHGQTHFDEQGNQISPRF